jgi:hypothetical protein
LHSYVPRHAGGQNNFFTPSLLQRRQIEQLKRFLSQSLPASQSRDGNEWKSVTFNATARCSPDHSRSRSARMTALRRGCCRRFSSPLAIV